MSSKKLPLPGNSLTMDDITNVISSSAVVRAMQKVDLNYEPTDKEKLDEIMTHPELLARAVGMIVNGRTDKEMGEVLGLQPFTVGFIRENEFVKVLCEECFKESMDKIKLGLNNITDNALGTLASLVDKDSTASEKVKYMAATTILQTVLKLNGELKDNKGAKANINVTQINNNSIPASAQEAYNVAIRDMASIIPVAKNIYGDDTDGSKG